MAYISIVDTGYVKTDNSGTRLSTSLRVNSGSMVTFKVTDINYQRKANIDANPNIGTYADADVNVNGFDNAGITIRGKINILDDTERTFPQFLVKFVKTLGYKALFYDATDGTLEKPERQIIYQIANVDGATFTAGEKTAFGIANSSVKHLCCFFSNVQINQSGKDQNFIEFTLEGVITKKHASVI